jgi:hypothetical protein
LNSTGDALEYFVRRGLALLLIPFALLFALIMVGIGNATTDATAPQLFLSAFVYLGLTLLCIIVAFRAARMWIGWLAVLIGWLPALCVMFPLRG